MPKRVQEKHSGPPERRRFLRESLTGSVPLLFEWATGRVRELARLLQEPPTPRKTSPPPAAADAAPAEAKKVLDERQAEFARDNPSARSFPEGNAWDETAPSQRGNERAK